MKKDTHKPAQDNATRTRPMLRLDRETLRIMNGGSQFPASPPLTRPSHCPTRCY